MPRAKSAVQRAAAKKAAAPLPASAPKQAPTSKSLPAEASVRAVAGLADDDRRPLGSVDVDSLSGEALRRYARRAGVFPRDVDNLTEDRLRQNTKLVIANHFELLAE